MFKVLIKPRFQLLLCNSLWFCEATNEVVARLIVWSYIFHLLMLFFLLISTNSYIVN